MNNDLIFDSHYSSLAGDGMSSSGIASPNVSMVEVILVWFLSDTNPQPRNERGMWFDYGIWQDSAIWYK